MGDAVKPPRPIPIGRNYRVVLADPPWRFELHSERGEAKSAQAQYACMGQGELAGFAQMIGLDWLCAPDCTLVMWATFPMLGDALSLMREWGFRYVTGGCWAKLTTNGKPAFGTGYVLRSAAEPFLIGARGSAAVESRSERNLILAERREHSVKPEQMYRLVEALWPGGPYLELFARRRRAGWDCYGDELGGFIAAGEACDAA